MRPMTSLVGLALVAGAGCAERTGWTADERAAVEAERARVMGAREMVAAPIFEREVLARAEVDACFDELGVVAGAPPCGVGEVEKREQTDLSTAAVADGAVIFGTAANVPCVFAGLFVPGLAPFATDDLACELGAADQRRPMMLRLDPATGDVTYLAVDDPLLDTTIGLFGAASYKGVVLLSGPNLGPEGIDGVNVFALAAEDGALLASATIPDYAGFTDGVVVGDDLYLAAATVDHRAGALLRWTGDAFDPIGFEAVADLGAPPADLVEHEGRLVVAEHMAIVPPGDVPAMPALLISPKIGPDGLEEGTELSRIFELDDYEPDPVIARAMSFGALASFQGRLFFTTTQSPAAATLAVFDAYGRPGTWFGRMMVDAHARRALSLLVMDDAGTDRQAVTLLYGDEQVAAFDPTGGIVGLPNALGQAPKFGEAGIGSPFNHYARLEATDDRLYVATFDGSTIAPAFLRPLIAQPPLLDLPEDVVDVFEPIADLANERFGGADLYRMDAPYLPLVAEDLTGLGNPSTYGVDVLLPLDDALYVGTSNPFNLRADGGFELLELTEIPPAE